MRNDAGTIWFECLMYISVSQFVKENAMHMWCSMWEKGDFAYNGNFEFILLEHFLSYKMTPYLLKLINTIRCYFLLSYFHLFLEKKSGANYHLSTGCITYLFSASTWCKNVHFQRLWCFIGIKLLVQHQRKQYCVLIQLIKLLNYWPSRITL